MFDRVVIIGLGLLGGSLGLAIRKNKLAEHVVGVSRRPEALEYAYQHKLIDESYDSADERLRSADLIILATPVRVIKDMIFDIGGYLSPKCLVTDVGSCKAEIVEEAEKHLPQFVGSHPMAGSEKSGVVNAKVDLFFGKTCLVTPTSKTSSESLEAITNFWQALDMKVRHMSPEDHDKVVSRLSHLPHIAASTLVESVPEELTDCVGDGFRDVTRLAGGSEEIWQDIVMMNQDNIVESIDLYLKELNDIRASVADGNEEAIKDFFRSNRMKRERMV